MDERHGYAGAELGVGRGPRRPVPGRDIGHGVRAGSLLDLLPELGDGIDPERRREARSSALVQVEVFRRGPWTPQITRRHGHPHTALLVTAGLLVREVEIGGRVFAELLGTGDLIYPWARGSGASVPEGRWRVLLDGHLAVVDELLIGRLAEHPSVALTLARLSTQRGRFLAALTITRRLRRVEDRLTFLFALLAERWGKVTPDGIVLRLPLTHELLAHLVGTRRQAVTSTVGELRRRGRLTQLQDGWLLAAGASSVPVREPLAVT